MTYPTITILGIAAIAGLVGFISAKVLNRSVSNKVQKAKPGTKPQTQPEQAILEEEVVKEVIKPETVPEVVEKEAVLEEVPPQVAEVVEPEVVEKVTETVESEAVEKEEVSEELPTEAKENVEAEAAKKKSILEELPTSVEKIVEKEVVEEAVLEELPTTTEESVKKETVLKQSPVVTLKLPFSSISLPIALTPGIHEFIKIRLTHFEQNSPSPLMLLAQSDRSQAPMINALLTQAKTRYQTDHCLHIMLPSLSETDTQNYFSVLAQQCGFQETVNNGIEFEQALLKQLNQYNPLFLLISYFERSTPPIQQQLAGMVRSLNESHANKLLIVLCGGEKLVQMKFLYGSHSLLNIAQEYFLPELEIADAYAIRNHCCPNLALDDEIAEQLLTLSGGHPILLHISLSLYQHNPTLVWQDYPTILSLDPLVWRLFIPFQSDIQEMREWLAQTEVAPSSVLFSYGSKHYALIQRLYWKNLLVVRHKHLCWRCEALRLAGRKVLEESNK